jgi:hypothetical protein
LTVPPNSWSISKIQPEFKASNYMVWNGKKSVAEGGVLSSPNAKPSKVLLPAWDEMEKPKSRKRGSLHPLPHTLSWRTA